MMYYTVEKIEKQLHDIQATIYRDVNPIPVFKIHTGEYPGAERPDLDDRGWDDFQVGSTWGGYDIVAWFRARVSIPEAWQGQKLALRFLVGPRDGGNSTAETMLYVNGCPLQALDVWHEEAWLPPELLVSGEIQIALKAWSGVLGVPDRRRFKLAQLALIDESAEHFFFFAGTLVKAAKTMDENDLRQVKLLQALDQAFQCIDFSQPRSKGYYQSIQEADECLSSLVDRLQAIRELKPRIVGIGHAHIDMAWLWRLRHSREKAARTFTTALHLMQQYPEYRFMHSTPQAYQFLKEDYPELFARVKERIQAGQWEITGGMWVEADTNLTSGESLIRQILFGKRFARKEFGVEMHTLWLPDVFGYSGALPQIARKSGLNTFMTTKISWSQFNRFPYDTFTWRGIDGTRLLTHFVTTPDACAPFYTYNGRLEPDEVKGIWDNYQQKEINDELLLLFGWGDGGGGPTREMLESARALKNLPGLPQVGMDRAEDYFERLEQRLEDQELPVWDGELYLEYHRGTYTSQAYNKRANRQAEILYHQAELWSTAADTLSGEDCYPVDALRAGWEKILLNQFHDILPGSSIRQVYEDSREDYAVIRSIGERTVDTSLRRIAGSIGAEKNGWVLFNGLSWERGGLVELPWTAELDQMTLESEGGEPAPAQVILGEDGKKKILVDVQAVPGLGYRTASLIEGNDAAQLPESGEDASTPHLLENRYYRLSLNDKGQLTSIWDKRCQREVLEAGKAGNVFQAFEDKPMNFDAWDIDIYYLRKMREVSDLVDLQVEESGPVRSTLRLTWRFLDSTIVQRIRLYGSSPRIDFETHIDWKESQILLKAAFPVAVRSTRATYEIQFGNIERPTHWNTSWDTARFEVVGHKWVDLSEGNYGVSLLNDCKYGHDIKDNLIRLTLIKSAIEPDETADRCQHQFTYSLLPHRGDWRQGNVIHEAYELNTPLLAAPSTGGQSGGLPNSFSFAELDAGHVILETVKKAEEGDAWIVRVYESQQCTNPAVRLSFGRPLRKVVECNLVEEGEDPVGCRDNQVIFPISPYEIKTFKVWFE